MSTRHALLAILLVGGVARVIGTTLVPLVFDEYQWMTVADSISLRPLHLPLHGDAHPAGGAYAVALGSALLGQNLVGYRLASVIAGTALIWIAFCLARPLGRAAALTAAALVAANEYLFGISRLATQESTYVALSAAAVLTFRRAVAPDASLRRWIEFGAILGLGLAVKEMLVLWIPVFIWEIAVRRGSRALFTKGPAMAALMLVIGVLPDVAWNLFLREPSEGLSNRGLMVQASRFGVGISAGPSALFLRPLYFKALENAVSEYPSMTSLPGALLLAGAVSSLFLSKTHDLRMWLRLGAVPFLLFTFFGKSTDAAAEFWWSDLSVVPFVLLTAAVLARLSPLLMPVAVAVGIPGFFAVAAARENCYPPAARPPKEVVERCYFDQRTFVARFPQRDHSALSRVGPVRLPVADHFERWTAAYLQWLSGGDSSGAPWDAHVPEHVRAAEKTRAERMLQALRTMRPDGRPGAVDE